MFRDPLASILRNDVPAPTLGRWLMGAFQEHYPEAFADTCRRVPSFESWPAAPWDVVEPSFRAAETDPAAFASWRTAFAVAEGVDYPLENLAEAQQFVRAAIEALHGYADATPTSALAADARRLASAIAHAFAAADCEQETTAEGVGRWLERLAG